MCLSNIQVAWYNPWYINVILSPFIPSLPIFSTFPSYLCDFHFFPAFSYLLFDLLSHIFLRSSLFIPVFPYYFSIYPYFPLHSGKFLEVGSFYKLFELKKSRIYFNENLLDFGASLTYSYLLDTNHQYFYNVFSILFLSSCKHNFRK